MNDQRLSVNFIAESVGISIGSAHSILRENLMMKKVSAQWVPRMLSDVQKVDRTETSASLLSLFNENPDNFISRFVTADKTWLHLFDPESKTQSMAWKHVTSPPPRKFHVVVSVRKVMDTILGCWRHCTDWLSWTWQHYYRNLLCWSDWKMLSSTEREETRKIASWDQDNATHLLTHLITSTDCHPKCRFRTAPSSTVFIRLGPQWLLFVSKTEGIHERTEIRWWWGCYLHCKWLARGPRSRILLQWNPGFGEMLDQVHFCWRGLCWKVTK